MAVRKLMVFSGGFLEHDKGLVIAGKSGLITAPLPIYMIETDEGRILYDCGVDPDVVEEPKKTWKGLLKLFHPKITPADHVVNRLREIGLTPDDIDYVVQSHLHFDHAGGLRFFPRSKILVHRDEYRFAHNPDPYARGGYLLKDFHYPDLHWEFIDGDRQLVPGVTIVLAHGHTPGILSLVVDLPEQGTVVLANDSIGLQENIDKMILSGVCWNPGLAYQAILRLKAIADRSHGRIWPNHDMEFWTALKKAPEFYT
jgi:glyoxylase-like metal-dependent hydrolase (beta-lactamase superfamily II)